MNPQSHFAFLARFLQLEAHPLTLRSAMAPSRLASILLRYPDLSPGIRSSCIQTFIRTLRIPIQPVLRDLPLYLQDPRLLPYPQSRLEAAFLAASSSPQKFAGFPLPQYQLAANISLHLHCLSLAAPFILPTRHLAVALDTGKTVAAFVTRQLVQFKVLTKIGTHDYAARIAQQYAFNPPPEVVLPPLIDFRCPFQTCCENEENYDGGT